MKKILKKIIINLCALVLISACHTIDHKDPFILPAEINKQKIKKNPEKIIVKKQPLTIKKIKNLNFLLNLTENQIYSKIGKGDFVKKEGKLKNIQYYFSNCFLDLFLINNNDYYYTNFIQMRSSKLLGSIDKVKCLDEIINKLKLNE
ncbi:MAG: hypothetical protein O2916_04420 [Proteobacteria bacterium]|nr:hypothetical protein [Pseudomonadota bacterium]